MFQVLDWGAITSDYIHEFKFKKIKSSMLLKETLDQYVKICKKLLSINTENLILCDNTSVI